MMGKTPPPPPLVVDSKTAAAMLCVSERTLWAMAHERDDRLPHVKFGRLTRYRISDLEEWIKSRRKGGDA